MRLFAAFSRMCAPRHRCSMGRADNDAGRAFLQGSFMRTIALLQSSDGDQDSCAAAATGTALPQPPRQSRRVCRKKGRLRGCCSLKLMSGLISARRVLCVHVRLCFHVGFSLPRACDCRCRRGPTAPMLGVESVVAAEAWLCIAHIVLLAAALEHNCTL